ncbi:MAG: carbohydrate ABC transporter permease [Anaerolineales bacterium]|nr:carbohydrate ABC transporter permease [Anaerolineales bacterium]
MLNNLSLVKLKPRISKIFLTLLVTVLVIIWFYPIGLTVITSLKTDTEFQHSPLSLPDNPSLKAFSDIFQMLDFGTMLKNSFILSFGGTALAILLSIFPAYALSRHPIPGRDIIFVILLTGLMVPQQSVVIGLHEQLKALDLLNKLIGVVIVHGVYGIPYVMLILRGYIVGIPKELEMAARVDGCTDWGVLRHIILPCMIPGIAVAGTLNIISIWNELFFSLIFFDSQKLFPVSVGLSILKQGRYFVSWNLPTAAALISQLPTVILYILAYQFIKEGLFSGALKG